MICRAVQGLLLSLFTWLQAAPVIADERMELHLVLAFDVSASVNDEEFDLQRRGTANALRSEQVAAAIDRAPGGIAIAIVQWSSSTRQAVGLDWVEMYDFSDVAAYADAVDAMPRRLPGGGTMIHSGLDFASRLLDAAPGYARRQVIDLAANGQSDGPKRLLETRDRLLSRGIVINGLAIEEDDATITEYFEAHVIGGPNAFVVTADGFEAFTEAMEYKLLREISGAVFSQDPGHAAPGVRRQAYAVQHGLLRQTGHDRQSSSEKPDLSSTCRHHCRPRLRPTDG